MILLALECSAAERSVAVARHGHVLGAARCQPTRDTPLFQMIDTVLREAGIGRDGIEGIALGLGPGSYTGIRCAIAAAQGWATTRPVRLLGLPSSHAVAHRAHGLGLRNEIGVVSDAQRGEFHVSVHQLDDSGARERTPIRIASRAEVVALAERMPLVGPDLEGCGIPIRAVTPDAASILALSWDGRDFIAPESMQPIYIRPTAFVKAPAPHPHGSGAVG